MTMQTRSFQTASATPFYFEISAPVRAVAVPASASAPVAVPASVEAEVPYTSRGSLALAMIATPLLMLVPMLIAAIG
jgi:hypothetical protein